MTEPTSPVKHATASIAPGASGGALEAGREAFARHAWQAAFDLLWQADAESALSGPDLEILAEAAFFATKANQRIEVLERAFRSYEATGDRLRAAYIGLDLAQNLILRSKVSLGSAWIRRAEQLLDGQPETYAHAFFAAFDSTQPGIACAISIQRALADHRSSSGFAPPVRIGLHTAEATQHGADYSGMGVHVAARVAALAREGQILISSDTLAEADGIEASEPFEVGIKGVSTPLTVASVSWTA
jgi:class 3 adenylate cyclase